MILNFGVGKARSKMPPLFTVSGGTYSYAQSVASDGTVNWELALLSGSGATLTFSRVVDYVDVFLVGGGWPGATPGNGGSGGSRLTCSGSTKIAVSSGTAYSFTVGGSKGTTSIFSRSAGSGGGSSGGSGGLNGVNAGTDGAYAFGASSSLLFSGRKYGAGGGGGGFNDRRNNYAGGAAGGATGGGSGSSNPYTAASSGAANTGAGGGGGYWDDYNCLASAGGAGGSGIIIIRNAR